MAYDYYDYMGTVYPDYSGYQTEYGYTDYSGDMDYADVDIYYSGYYNVSSTGNTYEYFYDGTTGSYLSGTSGVYLNANHDNYVAVYGYTTGESYSVTVTP